MTQAEMMAVLLQGCVGFTFGASAYLWAQAHGRNVWAVFLAVITIYTVAMVVMHDLDTARRWFLVVILVSTSLFILTSVSSIRITPRRRTK